jgi:hypothetical protein
MQVICYQQELALGESSFLTILSLLSQISDTSFKVSSIISVKEMRELLKGLWQEFILKWLSLVGTGYWPGHQLQWLLATDGFT